MNYPSPPPGSRFTAHKVWGLLLMFLLGYAVAHWLSRWQSRPLLDAQAEPRPVVPRGDLAADEVSTIELFRENSPAVVYITTAKFAIDRRYFDERLLSQGTGSGFIWNSDGYVVTNDHVLADSNFAQVTLFDQSIWKADVVGRASGKDLAVLRIDAPPERLHAILCGRWQFRRATPGQPGAIDRRQHGNLQSLGCIRRSGLCNSCGYGQPHRAAVDSARTHYPP
jgi:hypothetical protein